MMSENWAPGENIAMDNPLGGIKRGYFRLGEEEIPLAIRTSRICRKMNGHWRQVHHHGSIDDPQLLAWYQAAVLGK